MAKNTPGPWSISESIYTNEHGVKYVTIDHLVSGSGVIGLATVYEGCLDDGGDEMMANARLISIAPEMMEAMQEFCDRVDRGEVRSKRTYAKFKELIKSIGG